MSHAPQQTQLDDMLEKLSHDLRGRLASIMGYAEVILETGQEGNDLHDDILLSAKAILECSTKMLTQIAEINNYHSSNSSPD